MLSQLPWDWSNFISSAEGGHIEFDEDYIMKELNSNIIEFVRIKFKIDSAVYEKASAKEIIEGFKELNTFFDFIRVIEVLTQIMLIKVRGQLDPSQVEPDVVDFLKICYWYNRLKNVNTIKHRRKELVSRLCQKLLHRIQKRSRRTIDYSSLSDNEIKKKIKDILEEIRQEQSTHDKTQGSKWLNEYLNFINVCISELIFPTLANESGFRIDFTPANNAQGYDYDIIINGYPSQIKTLFSCEVFPIGEVEERKQKVYVEGLKWANKLYDDNQITFDLVKQEIIKFTKRTCIDKINEALRQRAEIIIIDGTRTIPGVLLNYFYTNDTKYVKFHDSLVEVVNNKIGEFVYIIFASTAYDNKFRVSSHVVKVPVIKVSQINQVDDTRKDEIFITNSI